MRSYKIMQEPGPRAHARRDRNARVYGTMLSQPREKRAGTAEGEGAKDALGQFVHDRYIAVFHPQYRGHRMEWRSTRASSRTWKSDDWKPTSTPNRDREWSVVVTLANGAAVHETRFLAWEQRS
jgi:hypothetical protein